jgi:hypothetical protein
MFFFKRKEIVVDCFTYLEAAYLNFPIDKAIKFYPDEFKKLKTPENATSIKQCNGVTDLFKTGFILPAWDTFSINMINDGTFDLAVNAKNVRAGHHNRNQYGGVYLNSGHVKLYSPWMMKEKTGVNFLWMHCGWNRTDNAEKLDIVPAVIDFKYQFFTHISMFVQKGQTIKYNAGDALVHLIPLSDYKLKIKTHLMDENEWLRAEKVLDNFQGYDDHRNLKYPTVLDKKKCPFGFGGN